MPQMGESIFEGTITKWFKKAGDPVAKDEPLFEISTDKVDAEIPSPVAGILREIRVAAGETVQVNAVVAVVAEAGEGPGLGTEGLGTERLGTELLGTHSAPEVSANLARVQLQGSPAVGEGGVEVVMPQMGESIFEGTITKWLKKAGDTVAKDEPLFEISTDKVDAEIPAPVAGVLSEIKVREGETVQVNVVVAIIGGVLGGTGQSVDAGVPVEEAAAAPAPDAPAEAEALIDGNRRLRSSPLVRRIAREQSLDLTRIVGTGSAGRITKEDVLQQLSKHGPGSTTKAAVSPAPKTPTTAQTAAPQAPLPEGAVPMTKMRAIIAQRMLESKQISPHAHTVYKVDMTRIVRLREREKGAYEKRNRVKLTYMPFIAAAVVQTLRKFPIVNASLANGAIHYHPHIHLGIAVALEWGLLVPVIRQAEERSFLSLAQSIADLADRARNKKLMPDEISGSTFTLTNAGVFGGEYGTPIINQPESAILAIGGLKKEPVVLTDKEGNDTIGIRSMQYFCLGFDHRIIDGADAGKFMRELQNTLEGWNREVC
jgi:2-oxoglutarate dehydrogenase E2 component (dihydrolipoamide succinyltransferase)